MTTMGVGRALRGGHPRDDSGTPAPSSGVLRALPSFVQAGGPEVGRGLPPARSLLRYLTSRDSAARASRYLLGNTASVAREPLSWPEPKGVSPTSRDLTGVFGACVGASAATFRTKWPDTKKPEAQTSTGLPANDPGGARTHDLLIKSQFWGCLGGFRGVRLT